MLRRITEAKRVNISRMNDPREEIGMQFSLAGRMVRSRMMWAGHVVQMEGDRTKESGGGETAMPLEKGKGV